MLSIGQVDHIDVGLWSSYLSINLLSGYATRKIGLCMVVPTGTFVLSDDVYIFLGHFFQQSSSSKPANSDQHLMLAYIKSSEQCCQNSIVLCMVLPSGHPTNK